MLQVDGALVFDCTVFLFTKGYIFQLKNKIEHSFQLHIPTKVVKNESSILKFEKDLNLLERP